MDDITIWFSGLALLVSIIALFYSLSSGRYQVQLSYEQRKFDLQLSYHATAIRLVDFSRNLMEEVETNAKVLDAQKNLIDANEELTYSYTRIKNLGSSPFGNNTYAESELIAMGADVIEINRVLDRAEESFQNGNIDGLHRAAVGIHERVFSNHTME